jgi:hypothetical protein
MRLLLTSAGIKNPSIHDALGGRKDLAGGGADTSGRHRARQVSDAARALARLRTTSRGGCT